MCWFLVGCVFGVCWGLFIFFYIHFCCVCFGFVLCGGGGVVYGGLDLLFDCVFGVCVLGLFCVFVRVVCLGWVGILFVSGVFSALFIYEA